MGLLQEGQRIRNTYEVERFLGEGAFAEVYRVRHRFLGRQAMKVFKRIGMTFQETEEMLSEAILLSRIGHPNIVRVFDADTLDTPEGMHGYFTMENVSGGSLDKFWRSHGSKLVPLETTVDIMRQVSRGLTRAHREQPPIIHRDIKPQNILVGYDLEGLRVRVSDFGLAKNVNPLTLMATAAGTLPFKPPEAFRGTKEDSCAGDVWGLGATMYLLLTDNLPVELDPDLGWRNTKAFEKDILPPSKLNPDVGPALDAVVMRCLARSASERYQDAGELAAALERWTPESFSPPEAKKSLNSTQQKSVLGEASPSNQEEAESMARRALEMASQQGQLEEAADLMEEAFNKASGLRKKYENRLRLWRRGVCM
jgi:serine/threonine-protein kinase